MSNTQADLRKRPLVVGLYGIPGCGKSYLMHQLQKCLDPAHFSFFEGSVVLDKLVPGGLEGFRLLPNAEKQMLRQTAISSIQDQCASFGKVGVVTGHILFWEKSNTEPVDVHVQRDMEVYTHILYINPGIATIAERRRSDSSRLRPIVSLHHLQEWIGKEKALLDRLCLEHGISYTPLSDSTTANTVSRLLDEIRQDSEENNANLVEHRLQKALAAFHPQETTEIMLVLDADRTLAPNDTGPLFWKLCERPGGAKLLSRIFGGRLGYSYAAFRQVAYLYQNCMQDLNFIKTCEGVADQVNMYPKMLWLLQTVSRIRNVGILVVTCGLAPIWKAVLSRHGLSHIPVIGCGGRSSDNLVVTGDAKAAIVSQLRKSGIYTIAFGDSPLDIPMLAQADEAIVVAGDISTRSTTMSSNLLKALNTKQLREGHQVLFDTTIPVVPMHFLPETEITNPHFISRLMERQGKTPAPLAKCNKMWPQCTAPQVLHETDAVAAKLLMTPMRDSKVQGVALRQAHADVGWYLVTRFLGEITGLETYNIPHVQGHKTGGYRVTHEDRTVIIALMRGGEPMAFGVSKALPDAMFLHANGPEDVKSDHLDGREVVVLVDSVVNSGATVVQFVKRVRELNASINIVVVAGTVQQKSVGACGMLTALSGVHVIALRLSENEFTGRRGTDTGNRLFNTTHLE